MPKTKTKTKAVVKANRFSSPPEPDYAERSAAAQKVATVELIKSGCADFEDSLAKAEAGSALWVQSVNKMRDAGLKFIQARGQEQLTFNEYGRAWYRDYEEFMTDQMSVRRMETAVKVARLMPKPAATLEDCKAAIQMVLIAADQLAQPHRDAPQLAHQRNLLSDFVSTTASYVTLLEKMEQELPLEKWEHDKLEKFVRTAAPVVAKFDAAKLLLGS